MAASLAIVLSAPAIGKATLCLAGSRWEPDRPYSH